MAKFSKDSEFIKGLFNSISLNYDKLNNIMSFGLHKGIKKQIVDELKNHSSLSSSLCPLSFLDLCTGTGDIAGMLKEKFPQAKVIGVDFSEKMLEIARGKYSDTGCKSGFSGQQQGVSNPLEFLQADCSDLPFEDESFDLCTISFGLRNVENIDNVLKEIYRVLKPNGVFVNLDLGKPNRFFNFFLKPYMYIWVSFVGKLFHGDETPYKYLAVSNETFPAQVELMEIFKKIGFQEIKNQNYLFGQIASQICRK